MKQLIYRLYAFFFNMSAKKGRVNEKLVALVSMHNENFCDSLGAIYDELKDRSGYEFLFISREDLKFSISGIFKLLSFFLVKSRKLAQAKYVFLNDNFLPMANLNFNKDAVVCQLWHGEGVFKKFGFAIPQPDDVRNVETESNKRLTHVVCSSKQVAPLYAEAFGVDVGQVLPLGSPRTDYFFKEGNAASARKELEELYPQIKGKQLVLYAPTFRGDAEQDRDILNNFDFDLFQLELGGEYVLAVRLHPQIHSDSDKLKDVINLTDYPDVRKLVLACDICITDYSSICMSFAMIGKKCVFYAYDLAYYKGSRDFYYDFENYVPGRIAKTMPELIEAIKAPTDEEKASRFAHFNFDDFDGKSAQRVLTALEIRV